MKGVQCYELFGGIALKIHTFSLMRFLPILYISERMSMVFSRPPNFRSPNQETFLTIMSGQASGASE